MHAYILSCALNLFLFPTVLFAGIHCIVILFMEKIKGAGVRLHSVGVLPVSQKLVKTLKKSGEK
jgi:hypothetical protein